MNVDQDKSVVLHHVRPGQESFLAEVLSGLQKPQKELPSKYLYDERGSGLFEHICALDEYYIPVIEASIMQAHIGEMVGLIGSRALLVEYGSGNCKKVRILLDNLRDPVGYLPVDISRKQLAHVARELAVDYPALEILPVCADYMNGFKLPKPERSPSQVVVYFPGSTIGNFDPVTAEQFLRHIATVCGAGGALLIGIDLKKDDSVLHRAYNDSEGVTAAFNLNLLQRINYELNSDFRLDWFEHSAFYNRDEGRIEMHLISQRAQDVHLDNATIHFAEGETIWTESSYKFDVDEFARLAAAAGFEVQRAWTDERQWFSVQYLVAKEE
jgi:dimethylhistidine N-methyltransferase